MASLRRMPLPSEAILVAKVEELREARRTKAAAA